MKAVIFDLNGVLTNASHIHYSVLAEVFNKYSLGLDEQQRFELILEMAGNERQDALRERYLEVLEEMDDTPVIEDHTVDAQDGLEPEEKIDDLPKEFYEEISELLKVREKDHLQATDGIKGLLMQLVVAEVPFFITSNDSVDTIKGRLAETGLDNYFTEDQIISGDDVRKPKPAPHIYNAAGRKAEADPSELIAVESGPSGIKSASHAGSYVIGFTQHHYDYPGRGHILFERGAVELASNTRELTRQIFSKLGIPAPKLEDEPDRGPVIHDSADTPATEPKSRQFRP